MVSPVRYTLETGISGINMHIKLCNFGIIFQVVLLKILPISIPVGSGWEPSAKTWRIKKWCIYRKTKKEILEWVVVSFFQIVFNYN